MAHRFRRWRIVTPVVVAAALVIAIASTSTASTARTSQATSSNGKVIVGLITKTDTNPFFVAMKKGAQRAAKASGAKLLTAAGKVDGDTATQITAIENMVTAGAKG